MSAEIRPLGRGAMTRIAMALMAAAVSVATPPSDAETGAEGVRTPVMRVCYLDLAAERAAHCAIPPRRSADAS